MATEKRVSGMTVGPFLFEEKHDAILETRERRKQASQAGRAKSRGESISEPEAQETPEPQES